MNAAILSLNAMSRRYDIEDPRFAYWVDQFGLLLGARLPARCIAMPLFLLTAFLWKILFILALKVSGFLYCIIMMALCFVLFIERDRRKTCFLSGGKVYPINEISIGS